MSFADFIGQLESWTKALKMKPIDYLGDPAKTRQVTEGISNLYGLANVGLQIGGNLDREGTGGAIRDAVGPMFQGKIQQAALANMFQDVGLYNRTPQASAEDPQVAPPPQAAPAAPVTPVPTASPSQLGSTQTPINSGSPSQLGPRLTTPSTPQGGYQGFMNALQSPQKQESIVLDPTGVLTAVGPAPTLPTPVVPNTYGVESPIPTNAPGYEQYMTELNKRLKKREESGQAPFVSGPVPF